MFCHEDGESKKIRVCCAKAPKPQLSSLRLSLSTSTDTDTADHYGGDEVGADEGRRLLGNLNEQENREDRAEIPVANDHEQEAKGEERADTDTKFSNVSIGFLLLGVFALIPGGALFFKKTDPKQGGATSQSPQSSAKGSMCENDTFDLSGRDIPEDENAFLASGLIESGVFGGTIEADAKHTTSA
jgi:hypothetical protein